jgi:hypothetical protein
MMGVEEGFVVEPAVTMPPSRQIDAVTSDGHAVSFWPRPNGGLRFAWDGRAEHPPFDQLGELRDGSPAVFVSADGAHVAYMAYRDGRMFVGRDGGESPAYADLTRSVPPVLSHDGSHMAYGAGDGEEYHLILDGQRVSDLPIAPIQAVLSPDGSRLAFVEMRPRDEDPDEYDVRVVLDAQPGPWIAGMRNDTGVMQFSPDGRRFAYREHTDDLRVRWVVDGVAQQWATDPVHFRDVVHRLKTRVAAVGDRVPATFSPDSSRFAYAADVPERGVAIVEDDVPGPVVKAVYPPVFSPDSRHLAYLARQFDDRLTLVIDGSPGPAWVAADATGPTFSPDGRHVAVTFGREEGGFLRRNRLCSLVVDGRVVFEQVADDILGKPSFSPDGNHVAWWFLRGEERRLMVDADPYPGVGNVESVPVYTTAGRLVCAVRTPDGAASTVMMNGRLGPPAENHDTMGSALRQWGRELAPDPLLPFAVSPDGTHVAWVGLFRGEWCPVLDDRVGPGFSMPFTWSFDADGRATWYLQREQILYRVTAAP